MSQSTFRAAVVFLIAVLTTSGAFAKSSSVSDSANGKSKPAVEKNAQKVILEGVKLLTPEKEIEASVETADFTAFVSKVDTAVQYLMYDSPQSTTLILLFECRPDGKSFKLIFQGQPGEKFQALIAQLRQAVDAVENLKVKSGKVEFSMQYKIAS
ncbi:MAG: hypothetical protein K0S28_203 [Paucimonas sp.]|jgi:hypothetical protein|nr:hypothetical protein [Paucimonas sp.]